MIVSPGTQIASDANPGDNRSRRQFGRLLHMLIALLERIENLVLHHPRRVIVVALAAVVAALYLGAGIELRTSRSELVSADDPEQLRWNRLREEISGPDPLIIALEPADRGAVELDRLQQAAAALAAELELLPEVDHTFFHLDMEWLADQALYLAPAEQLTKATEQVVDLLADPAGSMVLTDFAALNERIAARIRSSLASGAVLPSSAAAQEARRLEALIRAQRRFFEDPEAFVEGLSTSLPALAGTLAASALTDDGYLSTRDQRMLFVLVSPTDADAELAKQRRFVAAVRSVATPLLARHRVAYGLTGAAAMTVEEMEAIRSDGPKTSALAIVGVGVLAMLAFRRRRHALIGLLVLAIGVVWSIGAVRLEIGYLNMITTALIPILVGVGIDFAVHPISQYEIERSGAGDRKSAVRAAFRKTSAAVVVSALTTAAAFFSFTFMQFRGFAELGIVAGGGVLLCLIAALFVLPALLVLGGTAASARAAPLDRAWSAGADVLVRRPRTVVVAAVALTVASAWAGRGVGLETSLLELLPAGAESLRYLQVVSEETPLSAYVNLVATDDLKRLRELEERAGSAKAIARFESILQFLPGDPVASTEAVAGTAAMLERLQVSDAPWTGSDPILRSLRGLEAALEEAAEAAFVSGLADLVGPLEAARTEAEATRHLVTEAAPVNDDRWAAGQRDLRERLRTFLDRLRIAATQPAPTIATLPADVRRRFVTKNGRFLGYVHPAESIFDRPSLAAFNAASYDLSEDAIGFPILFAARSSQITSGFATTFAVGALLVLLILALDLRNVAHIALALVPVMLGVAWLVGLMRVLGLNFNLANLVAIPLILGVGIDNGVHMVHRFRREGHAGITTVLSHTGRAILVASLTTMVGFGSLGLAAHRGMASLGILLFLGVGASMIAAIAVLPNLLVTLGLVARR